MPTVTKVTATGKAIGAAKVIDTPVTPKNVTTEPMPVTQSYLWVCESSRANGKQCGKRIRVGVRCTDVQCTVCNRPMVCKTSGGVLEL